GPPPPPRPVMSSGGPGIRDPHPPPQNCDVIGGPRRLGPPSPPQPCDVIGDPQPCDVIGDPQPCDVIGGPRCLGPPCPVMSSGDRDVLAPHPLPPMVYDVMRGKSADGALQRFDKSLEEFYALCDQLELCLRLAHECLSQSFDSAKHSPTLVPTATKPEAAAGESLPYTQYLPLIKAQIAGAKDIHNALLEGANKITGKLPPPGAP
uniref:Mediator of RNA polymerase II transcription subunit 29 n=1 Tax=Apteryx owenii TaxID=8824 RepID=A0A8B9PVI0_APTOW